MLQFNKGRNRFNKLWTILRILIGVGLIVFLLLKLDVEKVISNIKNMNTGYLFCALIPYLFFIIFSAWRWQVLLDYKRINMNFKDSLIIYFIALFFNNFLPTTVGGDVMRIVYTMKDRKTDALAVVIADRMLGFIGLFIFGLFAVIYLYLFQKRSEFISIMVIGLVLLVLITSALFSKRIYSVLHPVVANLKILRIGEMINNLHRTMTEFGSAWNVIIICLLHSIIIQALLALSPFLVLRSMGNFQISIIPFFIYLPIINVISMIPVSFNALGVRENAYVLLFSRAGLNGETSLTVSLVSFFLVFIWSLLGGIFFIFYKKPEND
ncbi:MAG: flippase-like domain-containing protein [candidate division WOR-3 bacterium]|nr:flippase-like domain-containing protein [candidate division WOR-3 bacterium]